MSSVPTLQGLMDGLMAELSDNGNAGGRLPTAVRL